MQSGSTDQSMSIAINAPGAFYPGPGVPFIAISLGKSYATMPTLVIQSVPTITPNFPLTTAFLGGPPYQLFQVYGTSSVGNVTAIGNLVITSNAH